MGAAGSASQADSRESLRARLKALVDPVVSDHGAELVDVEVMGGGGSQTVRLLVHSSQGVTLQLCESISREVSDLLDAEDPVPGRYRLEVTSPGLDRPLRSDGDLRRAQGRKVRAVLTTGQVVTGRLVGWTSGEIELEEAGGQRPIARADIARATIEVEFN
ncbi:MAG: ribosome maturation factor RimP [Gemmatimonadota bacterium]